MKHDDESVSRQKLLDLSIYLDRLHEEKSSAIEVYNEMIEHAEQSIEDLLAMIKTGEEPPLRRRAYVKNSETGSKSYQHLKGSL